MLLNPRCISAIVALLSTAVPAEAQVEGNLFRGRYGDLSSEEKPREADIDDALAEAAIRRLAENLGPLGEHTMLSGGMNPGLQAAKLFDLNTMLMAHVQESSRLLHSPIEDGLDLLKGSKKSKSKSLKRASKKSKKSKASKKSSKSGSSEECSDDIVHEKKTANLVVNQINEPGFGELANKYSLAMASFKDYVYVGTLNAPDFDDELFQWFLGFPLNTRGAQVYRGKQWTADGKWTWQKVLDFSEGGRNPLNFGIRKMLVVKEYLYLATVNHVPAPNNGVEIWKSSDGENWTRENIPGFGVLHNVSGRSLAACGGYLYVGVENRASGAQIWRRPLTADGDLDGSIAQWQQVEDDGFGNQGNFFVSELEIFRDKLYAGTLNGLEGGELWTASNCDAPVAADVNFVNVFDGGFPDPSFDLVTNSGVLTLKTVHLQGVGGSVLFLGTVNYALGASLFVSFDGITFSPIFLFGDGDFRLSYVWSMEVYKNRLYVGMFQRPNIAYLLQGLDISNAGGFLSVLLGGGLGIDVPDVLRFLLNIVQNLFQLSQLFPQLGNLALIYLQNEVDLFSPDMGEFALFSVSLDSSFALTKETENAFGSCSQYGVRSMAVLNDKLIIGSAGADEFSATLVFEGIGKHY